MKVVDAFREGCKILDPILKLSGFGFVEGESGKSSGGEFASGKFVKGDRRLEIHFRHSLGLVTYHVDNLSLSHEAYMRALLGNHGNSRYPRFSDDPLDAFRALAFDLQNHCADFLSGDGKEFARCVEAARAREKLTPFERFAADSE